MPGDVAGERTYAATASDGLTLGGVAISKTADAPGGVATIGQAYDYSLALHVPAGTTLYGATVTDTVPDGLTVTGTSAGLGTVASTPNPTVRPPCSGRCRTAGSRARPPPRRHSRSPCA